MTSSRSISFARRGSAFTLAEMLIVIGIIVVLLALLIPSLAAARRAAARAACIANLHTIGHAITAYAMDNNGRIPFGPRAVQFSSSDLYRATGNVTTLLSLQTAAPPSPPVGLGLLMKKYLADTPKVVFCPGVDQPEDSDAALANFGVRQCQSDYFYRHGSSIDFSDPPKGPSTDHIRLADLGKNRNGQPIRALVMDQNYLANANPSLSFFGIHTRTCHNRQKVNVLYADGHTATLDNAGGRYTIDPGTNTFQSFTLILSAFEAADEQAN